MKTFALVCVLLAGCSGAPMLVQENGDHAARSTKEPKPSVRLVDEVEGRVRQLPCVENLSRWKRDYRYDFRSRRIDATKILFVLLEAEGKSERQISSPDDTYDGFPTGKFRLVAGVFDTKAKTVNVEHCGELVEGGAIP